MANVILRVISEKIQVTNQCKIDISINEDILKQYLQKQYFWLVWTLQLLQAIMNDMIDGLNIFMASQFY